MKVSISGLIALTMIAGLAGSVNAASFTLTPSTVSNTYSGPVSLDATVPGGDTVVVQKYLDVNGNGAVDAGEPLVQQFNLTDGQAGMVIGGVTNLNVPGDVNATAGQIGARLKFQNGDFSQTFVGSYLYVLSSPAGHFTPVTNSFTVTNFPFGQTITGTVLNNGVAAPGAIVLLFPAPRGGDHGPGRPVGGTVANGSGVYTIRVPVGTYVPMALDGGYIADYTASPVLTLGSGQSVSTNLFITNATSVLSGQLVDAANPGLGLPGVVVPASSQSGIIGVGFSDTNGNFSIGVASGTWQLGDDDSGLIVHGYVGYQNGTNVPAGTTGIVGAYPRATAMFYGQVRDNLGNPLANVDVQSSDNSSQFQSDGYSDTNGEYYVGVVGGLGDSDPWQLQVSSESPTNYVYSMPQFDLNGGGTNLAVGQALNVDITALPVTGQIAGRVQFNGSNVANVAVFASATINGIAYNVNVHTDANGNYTMGVAGGVWSVGLNCSGGNDSLDHILGAGNYQCPPSQNVTNAGTANFNVIPANSGQVFGYVRNTGNQPITNVTVYVGNGVGTLYATNTDNNGYYSFIVANGGWGVTLDCGQLDSLGYQCVGTNFFNVSSDTVEQDFVVQSSAAQPLQINSISLPAGTNGQFYSYAFQASGGVPPYVWYIPNYSTPPPNLVLSGSGVLSGTPMNNGKFYFDIVVADASSNVAEMDGVALTILNNPPLPPVVITNTSLSAGTTGVPYNVQLGATGGQPPYSWSLALGSADPPPGLALNSSGLISGTPAIGGTYYFQVQVADAYSTTTNKVLSIFVSGIVPAPTVSAPSRLPAGRFQMLLNGLANQNYTLQMSTNLGSTNWTTLYVTNNPATNSYLVTDPNATNRQRFYRILVGP